MHSVHKAIFVKVRNRPITPVWLGHDGVESSDSRRAEVTIVTIDAEDTQHILANIHPGLSTIVVLDPAPEFIWDAFAIKPEFEIRVGVETLFNQPEQDCIAIVSLLRDIFLMKPLPILRLGAESLIDQT